MPEVVRSFFNPNGSVQTNGLDQLNEAAAARAQQAALRAQDLQAQREILQAQLADSAANRALQLQTMGSFADKAGVEERMQAGRLGSAMDIAKLGETGATERANIGIRPQMAGIGLAMDQYKDSRNDTASQRAYQEAIAQGKLGLVKGIFDDHGAAVPGVGAAPSPMSLDDRMKMLLNIEHPEMAMDMQRRALDRAETRDTADTQAFSTMAASADPRVRAIGIAGLQKTRAFGQLPPGTVQGLAKPLASTGEDFMLKPEVQAELKALTTALIDASQDTNALELSQALKPRIDRLVARATEAGADPNQVLQAIKDQLAKAVQPSSLFTNPISTTLRAIPGLGGVIPQASRDAARQGVGL